MQKTTLSMNSIHLGVSIRKWEEDHKHRGSKTDSQDASRKDGRLSLRQQAVLSLEVDKVNRHSKRELYSSNDGKTHNKRKRERGCEQDIASSCGTDCSGWAVNPLNATDHDHDHEEEIVKNQRLAYIQ